MTETKMHRQGRGRHRAARTGAHEHTSIAAPLGTKPRAATAAPTTGNGRADGQSGRIGGTHVMAIDARAVNAQRLTAMITLVVNKLEPGNTSDTLMEQMIQLQLQR